MRHLSCLIAVCPRSKPTIVIPFQTQARSHQIGPVQFLSASEAKSYQAVKNGTNAGQTHDVEWMAMTQTSSIEEWSAQRRRSQHGGQA